MNKFQKELKEAIFEMSEAEKKDLRLSIAERKYMRKRAHQHLESLISRCCDVKALELSQTAISYRSNGIRTFNSDHNRYNDELTPQYWIDLAENDDA